MPFATPIVACLQRELGFRTLALLNVAAASTSAAVTICLGTLGVGPASYIWGFLASSTALAVLAFAMRPDVSVFRPTLRGARGILSFGGISSSVTVVNMAYEMLPRLVLGKLLSFEAVGLYSRAVTVCQLPDRGVVSALQPVVLPAFAARARSGGDLKTAYLHGHALMSAIQWPALVMLALLADPVVRVMLGPQWMDAAPLVRMIALATMAMAPAFMTFPVLVTTGRIRDTLWSSLISLPPSALIIVGASTIGLEAVAASMFVVAPLQMGVAFAFVRRAIGLTWREMALASRDSLTLALATALVPAVVIVASPDGFALGWIETAAAIAGGAAGWGLALGLLRHPIRTEILAVARLAPVALGRGRAVSPGVAK